MEDPAKEDKALKKTKKLLALALAAAMMLSIAACKGNTDDNAEKTDAPSNSSNTSTAGGAGRCTYTAVASGPSTWSPTDWQDDDELTYWSWCVTWLWGYMINDTNPASSSARTGSAMASSAA